MKKERLSTHDKDNRRARTRRRAAQPENGKDKGDSIILNFFLEVDTSDKDAQHIKGKMLGYGEGSGDGQCGAGGWSALCGVWCVVCVGGRAQLKLAKSKKGWPRCVLFAFYLAQHFIYAAWPLRCRFMPLPISGILAGLTIIIYFQMIAWTCK